MKKINAKYKILVLIPLFMLVGCKKNDIKEHKNVVSGIMSIGSKNVLLLEDTESNQERFCTLNYSYFNDTLFDDLCYLHLNDTLTIMTGGNFSSEDFYQDNTFLNSDFVGMKYNTDSVAARRKRGDVNILKQGMNATQQKTR